MGSPENGVRGSLLHAVPVPLPVVHTPPLCPLDADPGGPMSTRNGLSQPQWQPPRPQLGPPLWPRHDKIPAPGALSVSSQPQWRPPRAQQGPLSPPRLEPRPTPPIFAPPLARSRCITSCSGNPQEYNWDPHPCPDTTDPRPLPPGVCPAPGALPVRSPPSP